MLEPLTIPSVAGAASGADGLLDASCLRWEGAEWDMVKKLGNGKFATVFRLEERGGTRVRAAKVSALRTLSHWSRTQLELEVSIWASLTHPHVLHCYGHLADSERHVLLLELAAGGELFDRIASAVEFSEYTAARYISQLLCALAYLHSLQILHRDLKPENLLLTSDDDDAVLKVADFGAATRISAAGVPTTPCGSLGYAAPEQLRRGARGQPIGPHGPPGSLGPHPTDGYSTAVDVWATGIIAYVLLSGTMPFNPSGYTVASLEVIFPDETFGHVSPAGRAFVEALLERSAALRPSAAAARTHAWLRDNGVGVICCERCGLARAASALPTRPRHSPMLPTPTRLRELERLGGFRQKWADVANERWAIDAAPGEPQLGGLAEGLAEGLEGGLGGGPSASVGTLGDDLGENESGAEPPLLELPAEVHKKLRSANGAATATRSSASTMSTHTLSSTGGTSDDSPTDARPRR